MRNKHIFMKKRPKKDIFFHYNKLRIILFLIKMRYNEKKKVNTGEVINKVKKYSCSVVDENGKSLRKIFEAENETELFTKIKQGNLLLVSSEELEVAQTVVKKLKVKELILFCRQLSIMLQSGITVIKAIDILEQKSQRPRTRHVYALIYESLQKGNSLSTSMEEQGVFPTMLINMIRNGEAGGVLEENLGKMADHYEKDNKLRNKVRSASMYPIILMCVSLVLVLFLMTVVMPQFLTMYEGYTDLPLPTVIVMGISSFITQNWVGIIIAVIIAVFVVQALMKVPAVRYFIDNLKLTMPIIGKLNRTIYSSRCARNFATLYASGVQMIDLLSMTATMIGNAVIEEGFSFVIQKVSRGELISTALNDLGMFDPMFTSMVFIGEESGALDNILNKAADYFDEEADAAIQKMVALLEPTMIVFMGIMVAFIILAVMLPMYGAMGTIA